MDRNIECADQWSRATVRRGARRSRRRGQILPAFSLVPAVIAAGTVLLIGMMVSPPGYEARSAFVVDWKSLPSTQGDERAERARNEWRNAIISSIVGLQYSPKEISAVLDRAGDSDNGSAENAVAAAKMRKLLRVGLAEQTSDCDRFVVLMQDYDPEQAQAKADIVLRGIVSRLKENSRIGGGLALLNPQTNALAAIALNSLNYPGGESLKNSIKIEETRVKRRGSGYLWCVWLVAICMASVAGWLMHQVAGMITELHAAFIRASRVRPVKVAAISRLPLISQPPDPQPSALPLLWSPATQRSPDPC